MVNRTILIGRIGQDPEVRRLDSGKVVAKLSLATSENYKNAAGEKLQDTQWHTIVCWGKLAELAESLLKKGMAVYVEGKLTYNKWEDSAGNSRVRAEIVARTFQVTDWNNSNQEATTSQANKKDLIDSVAEGDARYGSTTTTNEETGDDDDLPF